MICSGYRLDYVIVSQRGSSFLPPAGWELSFPPPALIRDASDERPLGRRSGEKKERFTCVSR
jgi:hypothetical protein